MNSAFSARATILAIDDEISVLDEMSGPLSAAGYAFHPCSDPREALRMACRLIPDLIISDINLGDQNGLELCAAMQEVETLRDTPIVILSGAQIPDVVRKAHAAGGTYYLRKPFDPDVLIELVEKALWMPHLVRGRMAMRNATAKACSSPRG